MNVKSVFAALGLALVAFGAAALRDRQPATGFIVQKADAMSVARYKTDAYKIVGNRVAFINRNDNFGDAQVGDSVLLPAPYRIFPAH